MQAADRTPGGECVFDLAPYSSRCQLLRCVGSLKGWPPRLLTADDPERIEGYVAQLPAPGAVRLELHYTVLQRTVLAVLRQLVRMAKLKIG